MKIIKEAKRKTTERISCPHCKSILEFTKADVRSDSRIIHNLEHQYEYIICVVCGHIIEFSKPFKLFYYTIETEEEKEKERKMMHLTHKHRCNSEGRILETEIQDDLTNATLYLSSNKFTYKDYVAVLRYGIALGKQGYDGVEEREKFIYART